MRRYLSIIILALSMLMITTVVSAHTELKQGYMTMITDQGTIICRIGHEVVVGDRYLNSADQLYEVYQVKKDQAIVKLVKESEIRRGIFSRLRSSLMLLWYSNIFNAQVREKGPIAIYHTHSSESYEPTDGTSSQRSGGGILSVGERMARAFEKNGVPAVHSKASHDPHDAMSYDRSRRTAAQLLKKRPSVVLDVHRDAVPREDYATEIDGQGVTKIQLVVGRENPNFEATNNFAKRIKSVVDKKHPGFVKGIFYGKGKYNQDLTPRLMLLEVGTNTNHRDSAERAADIFAASAQEALYGAAGATANRGGWRSLFWIVGALVGGIALFMLLNRSSFKDITKEFTGAVGKPEQSDNQNEDNQDQNNEKSP